MQCHVMSSYGDYETELTAKWYVSLYESSQYVEGFLSQHKLLGHNLIDRSAHRQPERLL